MKNKILFIILISLLLPGINNSVWDYTGTQFWVQYGFLSIITLILSSIVLYVNKD